MAGNIRAISTAPFSSENAKMFGVYSDSTPNVSNRFTIPVLGFAPHWIFLIDIYSLMSSSGYNTYYSIISYDNNVTYLSYNARTYNGASYFTGITSNSYHITNSHTMYVQNFLSKQAINPNHPILIIAK